MPSPLLQFGGTALDESEDLLDHDLVRRDAGHLEPPMQGRGHVDGEAFQPLRGPRGNVDLLIRVYVGLRVKRER